MLVQMAQEKRGDIEMEYSEVKEQIKQKLPVQKEFGDSENLLELV